MNYQLNNWIISICAGEQQVESIKRCKELGLNVFSVDEKHNAVGFKYSDLFLSVKIDRINKIIDYLEQENIVPVGVSNFVSDAAIIPATILRSHYGIKKGSDLNNAYLKINKKKQKKMFQNSGVYYPRLFSKENKNILKSFLNSHSLIIKPEISSGSRGVEKVEGYLDLDRTVKNAMYFSENNKAIIEEYIEGNEYSLEIFCYKKDVKILMISRRHVNMHQSAIEIFSVNLDNKIQSKIYSQVLAIFKAMLYPQGPAHFELIIDKNNKPYFIDVAFRGGGFDIYNHIVKEVTGFDVITSTIKCDVNQKISFNIQLNYNKNFISHYILSNPGRFMGISGLSEARSMESVIIKIFKKKGQIIGENISDNDRIGQIICFGKDYSECNKLLAKILSTIKVIIN